MKFPRFVVYLALACAGHALGAQFIPEFNRVVDLFLILAVVTARESGVGAAIFAGLATGLLSDTLIGGGRYGLYGFSNTLTAYLMALLAQRLVVQRTVGLFLMLLIGAAIQQLVAAGLVFALIVELAWQDLFWAVTKVIVSGVLGIALFTLKNRFADNLTRRRRVRQSRIRLQG